MHFKRFAAAAALFSLCAPAFAQAPASDFTADRFRQHVTFLSDDLLEGRETGTRGYDIAARYVATGFAGLGLRPGARDGSWFQQVPFVRMAMTAPAALTIGGQSFAQGAGASFRQSAAAGRTELSAPTVFAGYGLEAPAFGLNDYRGLDVRGKIVVVLDGVPSGL
ncbi:MAG TPA: peptidase M28, partial [Allosphingosinicella sp.]